MKKKLNFPLLLLSIFFLLFILGCNNLTEPEPTSELENVTQKFNEAYRDSILFTSTRYLGTSFAPSVHIMNKDGTGMRSLTNKWFTFGASWSPNKWSILFIADTSFDKPARGLFIMDANGDNKKRISPVDENVWGCAFSPDGSKIGYIILDSRGFGKIKVMNRDGTNAAVITDWYGNLSHFSWTKDSKTITFSGFGSGGGQKIYSVDVNTHNVTVLLRSGYSPAWSPVDNKLAFMVNGYYTQIVIYDFDSKKRIPITSGKHFSNNPSWSKDGKSIILSSYEPGGGPSSLYITTIDSIAIKRVTDSNGSDWGAC